jgi:hypothetical protein
MGNDTSTLVDLLDGGEGKGDPVKDAIMRKRKGSVQSLTRNDPVDAGRLSPVRQQYQR